MLRHLARRAIRSTSRLAETSPGAVASHASTSDARARVTRDGAAPADPTQRALRARAVTRGLSTGANNARITPENSIEVTFVDRDGERRVVRGVLGENLLETAHRHDVELEGACEGSLACSTCHVVFESEDVFESLPEACDDENDMLDLAYGLTSTSRLGCQVTLERGKLEGATVIIPQATRNFAVDGFKPKPH